MSSCARWAERFCHLPVFDDDYHDWQNEHRKAALFLCDRVIRADVDTAPGKKMNIFSFGKDNNYKTFAGARMAAEKQSEQQLLSGTDPYGNPDAYMGSTALVHFRRRPGGNWRVMILVFSL